MAPTIGQRIEPEIDESKRGYLHPNQCSEVAKLGRGPFLESSA
jgi:hypothetical protein